MAQSGREFEVEADVLLDLISQGANRREIGDALGISQPTVRSKIKELQEQSPVLLEYRSLQSLELTALQQKILAKITDDKIEQAPLRDLVLAYKVLKDKEFMVEGKPTEIKGLVHYLLEIERQEQSEKKAITAAAEGEEADCVDVEFAEALGEEVKIAGIKLSNLPI
jgi:hypothetical protein